MGLWGDLIVGSLLWAGLIAGLTSVVRDCMKDRHLNPSFAYPEDESGRRCCCPADLVIAPHQHGES